MQVARSAKQSQTKPDQTNPAQAKPVQTKPDRAQPSGRGVDAPRRKSLSRDAVVAVAAELVDREGVDNLSLTRIAALLGVTQPALYKHVDDVHDLLRELALRARLMLLERVTNAAVGLSGDRAVHAVADAWRAFVREHPGLYEATDRHPLAGYAELENAVADIVDVLRKVLSAYSLSTVDVEHGAWSLRSAVHGFVSLESEGGHPAPMDLDDSFRRLVELLCSGYRHAGAATGSSN